MVEYVAGYPAAQPVAFFDGMMKVHAAEDPCVVDLGDDILKAVEGMRGARHGAGDAVGDFVGLEKCSQGVRQRLGDTAVIGVIFRMTWRDIERHPVGIHHRIWVAVGVRIADCGQGTPGEVVIFGVHAGGGRVCQRDEGHSAKPGGIRRIQPLKGHQLARALRE